MNDDNNYSCTIPIFAEELDRSFVWHTDYGNLRNIESFEAFKNKSDEYDGIIHDLASIRAFELQYSSYENTTKKYTYVYIETEKGIVAVRFDINDKQPEQYIKDLITYEKMKFQEEIEASKKREEDARAAKIAEIERAANRRCLLANARTPVRFSFFYFVHAIFLLLVAASCLVIMHFLREYIQYEKLKEQKGPALLYPIGGEAMLCVVTTILVITLITFGQTIVFSKNTCKGCEYCETNKKYLETLSIHTREELAFTTL